MWRKPKYGEDPEELSDHVSDAFQMIGSTGAWINNADTKAGLLAAAVAVLVAALAQQMSVLAEVLRPHGPTAWIALSLLSLLVMDMCTAVLALGFVIRPRTQLPETHSRFSFPTIADPAWKYHPANRTEVAAEAWSQARVLARIATVKFQVVKIAARATYSSVILYLAWLMAASLVPHGRG
jgi:hypothetical protein